MAQQLDDQNKQNITGVRTFIKAIWIILSVNKFRQFRTKRKIHIMKQTYLYCKILLLLVCISIPEYMSPMTFMRVDYVVNNIRYFGYEDYSNSYINWGDFLDFTEHGFTWNLDKRDTCIAPDGDIMPIFHLAFIAVSQHEKNNWYGPDENWGYERYYSGNKYMVDYIIDHDRKNGQYVEKRYYVVGFDTYCMKDALISLRTPIYYASKSLDFENAINLQKIQYGGCLSIECFTFLKCSKLKTVILEQSPYIEYYAFAGCHEIDTIVLLSEQDLPLLEAESAFEDEVYKNAIVYISDNLLQQAEEHPVWNKFEHRRSLRECPAGLLMEYKYAPGYEDKVD